MRIVGRSAASKRFLALLRWTAPTISRMAMYSKPAATSAAAISMMTD